MNTGYRLVLDPTGNTRLCDVVTAANRQISLLIGPEGGLTDSEIRTAAEQGCHRLRLGPRILRTETAGIATLAALQALHGDLS
nr:RsmE family RNA methyltransferase [Alkalilimnicola ehrlichii]